MKTKIGKYILIFISLNFISSCYKEERIKPANSVSSSTTPPATTVEPTLKATNILAIKSTSIDSNRNSYNSSIKVDLSLLLNKTGNIYLIVYTKQANFYDNRTLRQVHKSKLIAIPNNLNLDYSLIISGDSIDYSGYTLASQSVYLTAIDENGGILKLETVSNSNYPLYQYEIGTSYAFENRQNDSNFAINNLSFSFINTTDKNHNNYIQSATGATITFGYSYINTKKFYAEITYLVNNNEITYGKTGVFELEPSPNTWSTNSINVPIENSTPIDLNAKNYIPFRIKIYDADTKKLINSPSSYYGYNIESVADDNRMTTLSNLTLTSNEDLNKNGFSSTLNMNFDLNTSDNIDSYYSIQIEYGPYGFDYKYSLLSNVVKNGSNISMLVNARETLSKDYYDFTIYVREYNVSTNTTGALLKTYSKLDFNSLGQVKCERISEDK